MKKTTNTFLIFCIACLPILMANFGGSPGGRTGAPGDNGGTCATNGGCHGPKTPISQEMLSTDIPTAGYTPEDTVTITLSPSRNGVNKYGFEIIAEDTSGSPQGTFIGNPTVTATNSGIRATHKAQSTQGSNDSHSWEFQWVAPAAGTGDFKFYVAVLAANNNGGTGGDNVLIDTLDVTENLAAGINNIHALQLEVYPNPSQDFINLSLGSKESFNVFVVNGQGQQIFATSNKTTIDVGSLVAGRYYIKVEQGKTVYTAPFVKL